MRTLSRWLAIGSMVCGTLCAQTTAHDLPPAVLAAKTVAVINDTTDRDLAKGAEQALASWGQFQVTQDTENADLTLRFARVKTHSGQGSSSKDQDTGQWSTGYGMTFGSSTHMRAYLKDSDHPIFETETDSSKTKGDMACVNSFHDAYRTARQQAAQGTH